MPRHGRYSKGEDIWLCLPVAPSLNHRYVSKNFVLSQEWRDFKDQVAGICLEYGVRPLDGDLAMSIKWYRQRKQGDVDGKLKAVMDALQGYAYANDKQVKKLTIEREEDKESPRMVVNVKPWRPS